MAERTCAKCGKKGDFERLCTACWQSEHSLLESFKTLDAEVCARCERLHLGSKWPATWNIEDAFSKVFKRNARATPGVAVKAIELKVNLPEHTRNEGVTVKGEIDVKVRARVNEVNAELTEDYRIPVILKYTVCRFCSKANSQYFEGILQLRNASEAVKDEIAAEIAKHASHGVHLTKEKAVKGGYDLYLTSNTFLRSFAKSLHSRYGGELKISARLYSRDKLTSREVYRVNALIRLPDFVKGDVISIDGRVVQVTSVAAQLHATDLKTGKRVTLAYGSKGIEKLERQETQVSRVMPAVEVLDPDTYQSVAAENQQGARKLQPGDGVRVVKSAGRVYLLS